MRRSAKDKKKALEKVEDELRELSKKSANLNRTSFPKWTRKKIIV